VPVVPDRGRSFRGRSSDERRAERKARLLAAATKCFGERGYHGVTVREICAEAKLTERYFYESFENLQALFKAVFAQLSLEMSHAWMTAVMNAPREPVAIAEAFLFAFYRFISEEPRRARVLLYEANTVDANVLRFAESVVDDHASTMRGLIALLFPELSERGVDLDLLSHSLVGANVHVAGHWMRQGFKTPIEDVVRHQLEMYRALISYAQNTLGVEAIEQPAVAAPKPARTRSRAR
jgi:AcrR family transcriptional regulator